MLTRHFTYDNANYRLELDKYSFKLYREEKMSVMSGGLLAAMVGEEPLSYFPYSPEKPVVKEALRVLATDSYVNLRKTHSAAINRMIEVLASRELDWGTLLLAKKKLGLL